MSCTYTILKVSRLAWQEVEQRIRDAYAGTGEEQWAADYYFAGNGKHIVLGEVALEADHSLQPVALEYICKCGQRIDPHVCLEDKEYF